MFRRIKILLVFFLFAPEVFAINEKKIDEEIIRYESSHGSSAAVIYEPVSGRVLYAYNKKAAYEGRFPPGSLMKPLSALYYLENASGLNFSPENTIQCTGRFYIPENIEIQAFEQNVLNIQKDDRGKSYLRCSGTHGAVNLKEAIMKSCNNYFLNLAAKNPEKLYESLERTWHFHSGSKFRIKGYRELTFPEKRNPGSLRIVTSSIGEGGLILASPLKMAQIYGSIFGDTPLLSPFEAAGLRPLLKSQISFHPGNRTYIHSALRGTLHSGTLKNLVISNPEVMLLEGKTGSGTHAGKKFANHGWNALYFSYRSVKYVLITFVMKGTGSHEAAELSRLILNHL